MDLGGYAAEESFMGGRDVEVLRARGLKQLGRDCTLGHLKAAEVLSEKRVAPGD